MPSFYVDETGFTGEDLMAADQPIFVQGTNNFSGEEAQGIIDSFFKEAVGDELKHKKLSRQAPGQAQIAAFIKHLVLNPGRAATWVAHKEFAATTMVVEWWLEPLAHQSGLNLYENGGNHALANLLFTCLQGFWNHKFRQKVLLGFQKMVRSRTEERFNEFEELITRAKDEVADDEMRSEILRYFWPSFTLLGLEHVRQLPEHVLDIALPGLVRIGHYWRQQHEGPWEVVHDRSTSMAKQKWLWEKLSAPDLGSARFEGPHGAAIFPMNVSKTTFADSMVEKQIQLCDILAGATSAYVRLPEDNEYRTQLVEAGIEQLIIDSIWPSTAVTPEELGKKGWDGNKAIEWIAAAAAKKDAAAAA